MTFQSSHYLSYATLLLLLFAVSRPHDYSCGNAHVRMRNSASLVDER
eukprot:CAMPEP_0204634458 /NCGR_PEP_ID=MMETSP0717-20131115/29305_1 /ASSEMBLY_ACC=CAM_ASM_000666 /TAXON_ID=230516 /ORGANISM="Chaetoceros curvisetus" /LENGTH=46 /DNA_ID= /DNA_START= /DNA_END= /DNA_ORIENTATION=